MQGKIERMLYEHLTGHPDEAFSTDELCAVCYGPGVVERKHRVAVLRAIDKVLASSDWRYRHASLSRGNMRVFFNAASVASTAKGDFKRHYLGASAAWLGNRTWDSEPQRLIEAEREVGRHMIVRHGTDEERQQLVERRAAEHQLNVAKLQVAAMVAKNPVSVLVGSSRMMSGELAAMAEKAGRFWSRMILT